MPCVISESEQNRFLDFMVNLNQRGTMQTLYEVEWIASVPEDEHGDADIDNCEYGRRRFPSMALAQAFAKKVIPGLPWEVAYIRPMCQITKAELDADDELDYWIEAGKIFTYMGRAVEVSS